MALRTYKRQLSTLNALCVFNILDVVVAGRNRYHYSLRFIIFIYFDWLVVKATDFTSEKSQIGAKDRSSVLLGVSMRHKRNYGQMIYIATNGFCQIRI